MSATLNSTVSAGVSTSSGDVGAGDPASSQSSYASETTVSLGGTSGSDGGLGATVLADASAFGTDTVVGMDIDAAAIESGGTEAVSVSALIVAIAQSAEGDPFAGATLTIELAGDADAYLGITHSTTSTVSDPSETTVVSTASASLTALDLSWSGDGATVPSDGGPGLTATPDPVAAQQPAVDPGGITVEDCGCSDLDLGYGGLDIDGNLAVFDINATALGQDTLAEVNADVAVVEDQFSVATAVVTVAIG